MALVDFLTPLHSSTKRDYLERVTRGDKADCARVAKEFGRDYWDGDRKYGYGGYRYDGRWAPVARAMLDHYGLGPGSRVLDVGCGKAFLLHEMRRIEPGLEVRGIDVSAYAIAQAKEEVREFLSVGRAEKLPFDDGAFDLVFSITTLHNLYVHQLAEAIAEIERVGRDAGGRYIVVESYRDEREKANLLHWQLTCECFYTPEEWEWLLLRFGYTGDHSFIYFE